MANSYRANRGKLISLVDDSAEPQGEDDYADGSELDETI